MPIPTTKPGRQSIGRQHGFNMMGMGARANISKEGVINSAIDPSSVAVFLTPGLVPTIELAPNLVIGGRLSRTGLSAEASEYHSERR